MNYYLAIDIGASSGRHMLGYLEEGHMKLEEINFELLLYLILYSNIHLLIYLMNLMKYYLMIFLKEN